LSGHVALFTLHGDASDEGIRKAAIKPEEKKT